MSIGRLTNLLFPKRAESPESLGGYPLARGERSAAVVPANVRDAVAGNFTPSGTTTVVLPTRVAGDVLAVVAGGPSPPAANTGWSARALTATGDGTNSIVVYIKTSDGVDSTPFGANVSGDTPYTAFSFKDTAVGIGSYGVGSSSGSTGNMTIASTTFLTVGGTLLTGGLSVGAAQTLTMPGGQTSYAPSTAGNLTLRCGTESVGVGAAGSRTITTTVNAFWAGINAGIR